MKEKTEEQKEILGDYKKAERKYYGMTINDFLRNEENITDTSCKEEINKVVSALEGLMYTPDVLYRATNNYYFQEIKKGDMICDKAFLSTTSDMSFVCDFMTDQDSAMFIIENCADIPSINVVDILGNQNNEQEFILPRNLPLRVLEKRQYKSTEFGNFVRDYPEIGVNERAFYGLNSITVYSVEPGENMMKRTMSVIREFKKRNS